MKRIQPLLVVSLIIFISIILAFIFISESNYATIQVLTYQRNRAKGFILSENKGLSMNQLKAKYRISNPEKLDDNTLYYNLLYFHFNEKGILDAIE